MALPFFLHGLVVGFFRVVSMRESSANAAEVNDKGVFWALLALMAWAPLPLGSYRTAPAAVLVLCALMLLGAVAWCWRKQADAAWSRLAQFKWPLGLLALFVVLVWLQTVPLPQALVAVLSPEAAAVQAGLPQQFLSLDVFQTRLYASLSVAYVAVFVAVLLTVRSKQRLEQLALWVVVVGVGQAVLGVVLFSLSAKYHVFFFEIHHTRVFGTFSYHNHFAGYMELCLSVGIGLMLARIGNPVRVSGGWRERAANALKFLLSNKMLLRMLLVVMVIGLVLTRSRMGNAGFFAALLVVGGVALLLTRRSAPAMMALVLSLVIVDLVVVGSWVGLERVVDRVEGTMLTTAEGGSQESVEQRQDAAWHALDLVRDFPVVGSGGGTFYNTYLRYRTLSKGYFNHAHNDYVELAADVGLVGLGLLGAVVVLTFAVCASTLAKRRSSLPRGMAFGVMMAMVALAIHSTVDFNLQMPANALQMMTVLAMGWVAYRLPSGRERSGRVLA